MDPQRLVKVLEKLEIRGRAETIQTTALLRSAKKIKKNPEDSMRLAVTQILVKDHQQTLV